MDKYKLFMDKYEWFIDKLYSVSYYERHIDVKCQIKNRIKMSNRKYYDANKEYMKKQEDVYTDKLYFEALNLSNCLTNYFKNRNWLTYFKPIRLIEHRNDSLCITFGEFELNEYQKYYTIKLS